MKVICSGRQMSVRDSLREMAEKKLAILDKYFPEEVTAYVTFKVRKNTEIIEITVSLGNTVFRSEEGAETFRTALDSAIDTLERQIRRNKTRLQKRLRSGSMRLPEEDVTVQEDESNVIRTKTYPIRPMSPEEAILQMDLLGHRFFVFVNGENNKTEVVYKRDDGGYGILIPE